MFKNRNIYFIISLISIYPVVVFSANNKQKLFGRVVDDANKPVANVLVTAISMNNESLRYALASETTTDKDGRYSFDDAVLGEDYSLELFAAGFVYRTDRAAAGNGKEVVTVLESESVHTLQGKVTGYLSGQSVIGTKVILIGEKVYKNECVIKTEDGTFTFDNVPKNIGQGIIYAVKDDLCSDSKMVRSSTKEVELPLKRSMVINGIITTDAGKPIEDCVVVVRPFMVSGFSVTQKTNENGRFKITNIPAGMYKLIASHQKYFQKQGNTEITIKGEAGGTYTAELTMFDKVPVEGHVTGPDGKPIAGAIVVGVSSGSSGSGYTKTDSNGSFKLYSKELSPLEARGPSVGMDIAAVADNYGIGKTTVIKSRDNWNQDSSEKNVVIKLNGRMRIYGNVTDSEGNLIPGVRVYLHPNNMPIATTDASGNYDLSWFNLPENENGEFNVTFRSPRPDDGGVREGVALVDRRAMEMPKQGTQFYRHKVVSVKVENGRNFELNTVLDSAQLLTVHGKVTDNNGKPVAQASLMLFAGKPKADEWLDKIDFYRRRGGGGGGMSVDDIVLVPLARTVTDKDGNYVFCVAKENQESLQVSSHATKIDPNLYSLGVMSVNGITKIITDIKPQASQNNMEYDFQLNVSP